jgi:hypothetical protein
MSKVTMRLPGGLVQRARISVIKERRALQKITVVLEAYLNRVKTEGGCWR